MTKKLLLLFCLAFCLRSWCQNNGLQQILTAADDTIKVNKLTAYTKSILYQEPEKAKELAPQILQLSKKLQYNEGIASAFSILGALDFSAGKHGKSIPYFKEAANYYKRANNLKGEAKSLGNLASAYMAIGKSDSSIVSRLAAVEILEKLKDSPEGLSTLSMQYHNLATAYENLLKQSDKALSYYQKAENIARQGNDTAMIVNSLWAIAQGLQKKGQRKEAFAAAQESLRMAKASQNNFLLSHGYESYAMVLLDADRFDEALAAAHTALVYGERSGDIVRFVSNSLTYSNALEKKQEYKKQIAVLEKVLERLNANGQVEFMADVFRPLAAAYYKTGNFKAAYDYQTKNLQYKDSVVKVENNRIIADMEFRYQTARKEKALSDKQLQIAQKEVQLQKSRQYTWLSIAAALVALLVASLVYANFSHKKKQHLREVQSLQQQKEIQILQALMQGEEKERSRIAKDLHDGVAGMLAAVKMHFSSIPDGGHLHRAEGYEQGMKLLNEATQEIRKTSHNLMPEVLLQHGLDEALRRYCSNINNSITLQIQYDSWGEVARFKDSFELSVYRIVQELLNNIIKHSKATEAIVQLTQQNNLLSISIEDNGEGFSSTKNKDGMGLRSLQGRVKSLNGKLEIESSEKSGVSAYLEFDIAELKKQVIEHA